MPLRNATLQEEGIFITTPVPASAGDVLTDEALDFVAKLERAFRSRRRQILQRREQRQTELDAGALPDFLPETADVRADAWNVAEIPEDLRDRRVEITGPVDRKMIINALNSGAKVYMADFEDSHSPTWHGTLAGQVNLREAINGMIQFVSPQGKLYRLNDQTATLMVRPRGWHLPEKHVLVDGEPVSASLFDFGLFLFQNARALIEKGSGPYFYLPKLESHLEARLWNDVFVLAQKEMGLPQGTIKSTVLIETILAAFEMEEILYELRDHIVGLNCGRWDYIFSFIKRFRNRPEFLLPDRNQLTMTTHFLRCYSLLLIQTCHFRGAQAMGGMAAQIPVKNDPVANTVALEKVRQDKLREVRDGHDGTWVAHPGLVPIAMKAFNEHMPGPNQLNLLREDVFVSASDLLSVPQGTITEAGLRNNVSVGLQYLEAWLRGSGCVPINNLMEDAATAEIARTQIWQWMHNPGGVLQGGRRVTVELFRKVMSQELGRIRESLGDFIYASGKFDLAAELFDNLICSDECAEYLTLDAYEYLP